MQYPFALGFVKMSIVSFYLRVFPQKEFRTVCYAVMGIVVAATLSITFSQAFACNPISDAWKAVPTGSCVNREALQTAGSVINLVTDIIVLLLPMKYLYCMSTFFTFFFFPQWLTLATKPWLWTRANGMGSWHCSLWA